MKKIYMTMFFSLLVVVGMAQSHKAMNDSRLPKTQNARVVKKNDLNLQRSTESQKATISTEQVVATSFSSLEAAVKAKKANEALKADALATQYPLPDGAFYEGYTRDYKSYGGLFLHYPAITPLQYWPWTSKKPATFEWFYYEGVDKPNSTAVEGELEEDGTLNFVSDITPAGYINYIPMLKTTAGEETATFVMGQGSTFSYGMASSIERSLTEDGTDFDGTEEFAALTLANMHLNRPTSGNLYSGFGGNNAFGPIYSNDKGACVGVMQVIPQLVSPLYLESISALAFETGGTAVPEGGEMKFEMYYINEDGSLGDLIAESSTTEFVKTYNTQGAFIFKFEAEEDGFITPMPVVVGTEAPVAVIIKGFDATWNFRFLFGLNDGFGGSSYTLHGEDLAVSTFGYTNAPNTPQADLYIQYNGMFNCLAFFDETQSSINYPVEGGWGIVENDTYPDLFLYSAYNMDEEKTDLWIEDAPDWIVDFDFADDFYEEYNVVVFYFAAEALPEGVTGRSGEIVLASHGIKLNVPVRQGEMTSVNNTKHSDLKVSKVNNGVRVNYPSEFTKVALFNTAGQKIGDYQLPNSGDFIVPNTNDKGIYILKFDGAKSETVKVIR